MIRVTPQAIPDVLLIEPDRFSDARGHFTETFRANVLAEAGFARDFVQDNHAYSARRGTVRGLHVQTGASAQAKLVRVTRGAVLDVAVDLRAGSPWFGKAVAVELSAENGRQLFAPEGFAHGYMTLADETEATYKVSAYYSAQAEIGLLWSDPALGVEWPVSAQAAIVNGRDRAWPGLADIGAPFVYEGLK